MTNQKIIHTLTVFDFVTKLWLSRGLNTLGKLLVFSHMLINWSSFSLNPKFLRVTTVSRYQGQKLRKKNSSSYTDEWTRRAAPGTVWQHTGPNSCNSLCKSFVSKGWPASILFKSGWAQTWYTQEYGLPAILYEHGEDRGLWGHSLDYCRLRVMWRRNKMLLGLLDLWWRHFGPSCLGEFSSQLQIHSRQCWVTPADSAEPRSKSSRTESYNCSLLG